MHSYEVSLLISLMQQLAILIPSLLISAFITLAVTKSYSRVSVFSGLAVLPAIALFSVTSDLRFGVRSMHDLSAGIAVVWLAIGPIWLACTCGAALAFSLKARPSRIGLCSFLLGVLATPLGALALLYAACSLGVRCNF
jgi:hypothetical protein